MLLDSFETKQRILAEFLPICAFEGWNQQALLLAMKNCGISENFANLIFENGIVDLARFYIESQNQKAAELMGDLSGKKIRDKIRLSLYARFEVEKDNQIVLQRLINFYLNPKNFASFEMGARPVVQGLRTCYDIADFIWKNINDSSTDFNFYTKRLTLGKIIFRATLCFTKNDLEKTKNLIDLEIEKVMKFEKRKAQAKKFISEVFLDEKGSPKSPKEIIKSLPFFRLMKF